MSEIRSQYSEVLPSESISQVESHNHYSEEEEEIYSYPPSQSNIPTHKPLKKKKRSYNAYFIVTNENCNVPAHGIVSKTMEHPEGDGSTGRF